MQNCLEMQTFSQNLAKLLAAKGMTKQALADLTGLSRSHVSRIVHGHMSITVDTAAGIAHAIGVDLSELFRADLNPARTREEQAA